MAFFRLPLPPSSELNAAAYLLKSPNVLKAAFVVKGAVPWITLIVFTNPFLMALMKVLLLICAL